MPLAALLLILAQNPAPKPPMPKPPVPAAADHQFDFWLGEWEVKDPSGKVVGHNRIESIAGGFGLLEHWTGTGGGSGKSLNGFDPADGKWHQTWIGTGGGVLQFEGGLQEGRMCMEGVQSTPKGRVRNRMTWTPREDGSVLQVWEQSADEGKTWKVTFEGIYRKAKGGA